MLAHERITRRHLPHWYVPGACHFVTYRLHGTIPATVLERYKADRANNLLGPIPSGMTRSQYRERVHKLFFADIDQYLDSSRDVSWLAVPAVAAIVRASLYFLHGQTCHLIAYCIMPNHVHALFQPLDPAPHPDKEGREPGESLDGLSPLAETPKRHKGFTAHRANALLNREGTFWQSESYDHWVRDEEELERIIHYIAFNPVKAGLVAKPHEWFFSSAHDRFLQDGSEEGWINLPCNPGETNRHPDSSEKQGSKPGQS